MAGAFIKARIDDKEVQKLFADIAQKSVRMRPAFIAIGEEIVKSVRQNFLASGRPNRWKPLATATLFGVIGGNKGYTKGGVSGGRLRASSKRTLANKKILIGQGIRGGLMGSIHRGATDNSSVTVGTDKPYGAVHQFGINKTVTVKRHVKTVFGTRSSSVSQYKRYMRIDARPYLLVQTDDWPRIKAILKDFFLSK